MDDELFYKRCPTKNCKMISGFYLSRSEIENDEEQICNNCGKEHKLSKWKESTIDLYNDQTTIWT